MKPFIYLLALCCLSVALASAATEDKFEFSDPAKHKLFIELTKELRCPKCQNQNIADSDAMIAIDLKRKVYQLVKQGSSHQEVVDYMKQRYGDFVYYQPPVNSMTIWLWLLPAIFVLLALVIFVISRKSQVVEEDPERLAKAEKMLEDEQ